MVFVQLSGDREALVLFRPLLRDALQERELWLTVKPALALASLRIHLDETIRRAPMRGPDAIVVDYIGVVDLIHSDGRPPQRIQLGSRAAGEPPDTIKGKAVKSLAQRLANEIRAALR